MRALEGERLARWLEAQFADFGEDLPLWTGIAHALPGPMLELGCGTGRVLLPLLRKGCRILGIDREEALLRRLKQRAADQALTDALLLLQADIRALPLRAHFRLILAPLNVLAHTDDQQLIGCLTRAAGNLSTDGLFAAEFPSPSFLADPEEEGEPLEIFFDPKTGYPVQVSARTERTPDDRRLDVEWFYDELTPTGEVHRFVLAHRYWLRTPDELRRLCHQAGFGASQVFGSYDLDPIGPESPLLLLLASHQPIPAALLD